VMKPIQRTKGPSQFGMRSQFHRNTGLSRMRKRYFILQLAMGILLGGVSLIPPAAWAQLTSISQGRSPGAAALEEYKIGSGDVLAVSVADAPEFGGKFRVPDTGLIEIPGVSGQLRAEGQSPSELAHTIREALIAAKQLRDPRVSVYVDEFHGRTVTVLGAVAKPSVYPIAKRTNVREALSLAGGTLPNS